MKKTSTVFLKAVLVLTGLIVLSGLLYFPKIEGRAANLDVVSIYSDPFILYVYAASVPFFVGLYQAFKLLSLLEANKAFTQAAVARLKNIRRASLTLIGLIGMAMIYIRFFVHGDDPAGPLMLGLCMSVAFSVIATAAGVFEKLFQNAVDIKSEHDLTV